VKACFLFVVLVIGVADFLYTRQVRLASVAFLYAILQLQADAAAARFARAGFRADTGTDPAAGRAEPERASASAAPEDEDEAETIRVRPLRGGKMPHYESYASHARPDAEDRTAPRALPPPMEAKQKAERETRRDETSARKRKASSPGPSPFLRIPNFRGASHEVLGVKENSATRTILRAFRHWIKKYHPDHRGEGVGGEQARLLAGAKETLLEKRKQSRRAA
jgi:DnaJ-domain-containing protein 1